MPAKNFLHNELYGQDKKKSELKYFGAMPLTRKKIHQQTAYFGHLALLFPSGIRCLHTHVATEPLIKALSMKKVAGV